MAFDTPQKLSFDIIFLPEYESNQNGLTGIIQAILNNTLIAVIDEAGSDSESAKCSSCKEHQTRHDRLME